MLKKRILFLSGNDFKEKSIQVLRMTPEAFAAAGWDVTYIVSRDQSKHGSYFYERPFDPPGIKVIRFEMPLSRLRSRMGSGLVQVLLTQISAYLSMVKLAFKARSWIKSNGEPDVIYGYEVQGVCANLILRHCLNLHETKTVNRFQGTWINQFLEQKRWLKLLLNVDDIIALKSYADLCIMTNDGTKGDLAMKSLRSKALPSLKFWVNGVNSQLLEMDDFAELNKSYAQNENKLKLLTVCRLESWKRIDRVLEILNILVNELKFTEVVYYVVGDGDQRANLEGLTNSLGLSGHVIFVGGLNHSEVKKYLNYCDIFLSTYDLSNVGNPLLEAISAHKIIFTLDNGDTSSWIEHGVNGFIYKIDDGLFKTIAKDILEVYSNNVLKNNVISGVIETAKTKLWTWDERFKAEVEHVGKLISNDED